MKFNQLFAVALILGMIISLMFSSQAQAAERYWIASGASSNSVFITDNVATNSDVAAGVDVFAANAPISKSETQNSKLKSWVVSLNNLQSLVSVSCSP